MVTGGLVTRGGLVYVPSSLLITCRDERGIGLGFEL